MHGGTKKQGSKKKDMINWCVLSSRCSDTYAATLRSGMINSGAENLSITALSDAMEVSPSASWGPLTILIHGEHTTFVGPDGNNCIDPS